MSQAQRRKNYALDMDNDNIDDLLEMLDRNPRTIPGEFNLQSDRIWYATKKRGVI